MPTEAVPPCRLRPFRVPSQLLTSKGVKFYSSAARPAATPAPSSLAARRPAAAAGGMPWLRRGLSTAVPATMKVDAA